MGSNSADRIVTIFEPRITTTEAQYLQNSEHVIVNGFVKSLRARTNITSIPEVDLPNIPIEDSRTERLSKVRNIEWKEPRKHLKLWTKNASNSWFHIATVSLLNIPPYRLFDLQVYFSANLMIELGESGAIGASIENAGYGLLSGQDEVVIFGSGTTEIIAIPKQVPSIGVSNNYGWTITNESQLILPSDANRKQITLTNTGGSKVYLSFGKPAEIGEGICLMPQGGSYELNRTNYPMPLFISAVADTASTLSGLVAW